jgi:hypothetical protein
MYKVVECCRIGSELRRSSGGYRQVGHGVHGGELRNSQGSTEKLNVRHYPGGARLATPTWSVKPHQ